MVGHPASFELTDPLAFCCGKSKYAQTNLRWKNYGIMGLTTDWLTTKRFTVSSHQSTNNTRRRIEHWLLGWPWQTHTNLYYKAAEWTTWHLITVLCFFFFFCMFVSFNWQGIGVSLAIRAHNEQSVIYLCGS